MTATQQFVVAMFANAVLLAGVLVTFLSTRGTKKEVKGIDAKVEEVHMVVNSRLTQLIEKTEQLAFKQGAQQERVDAALLRDAAAVAPIGAATVVVTAETAHVAAPKVVADPPERGPG